MTVPKRSKQKAINADRLWPLSEMKSQEDLVGNRSVILVRRT